MPLSPPRNNWTEQQQHNHTTTPTRTWISSQDRSSCSTLRSASGSGTCRGSDVHASVTHFLPISSWKLQSYAAASWKHHGHPTAAACAQHELQASPVSAYPSSCLAHPQLGHQRCRQRPRAAAEAVALSAARRFAVGLVGGGRGQRQLKPLPGGTGEQGGCLTSFKTTAMGVITMQPALQASML